VADRRGANGPPGRRPANRKQPQSQQSCARRAFGRRPVSHLFYKGGTATCTKDRDDNGV